MNSPRDPQAGAFSDAPPTTLAGHLTVAGQFAKRVAMQPGAIALTDGTRSLTYGELAQRVAQLAGALRASGLRRGDRVAMWSENGFEYIELELAAAQLGLIVACLNWRLTAEEQRHCIRLVAPSLVIVSPRYLPALLRLGEVAPAHLVLGEIFEAWRNAAQPVPPDESVSPEDGLVILYTSGTTGLPKGALVSQRAMVARAMVFSADYGIRGSDGFIAWSPLFHMAATDHSLATLMLGGQVMLCDGLDLPRILDWAETEPLGWLLAMPGMIEPMIDQLRARGRKPLSVRMLGAMADLVPRHQIAELSGLVGAPYLNSFGSTETGLPPCSGALLPAGEVPASLDKRESSWCEVRLVDEEDREAPPGTPGEMTVRGPTVFSGYWGNEAATRQDFRGGRFHMGDVFVRQPDGSLAFVDRLKYLIKSGGENIYPAEIERVLLAHPTVRDAAVVRRPDARWGEVPVAFVACDNGAWDEAALLAHCRAHLPGYKLPRELRPIALDALPRSSTGKIQRHELEKRL
ncbi:class I adenylate-forming enzyme family protein [Ramlibacter sp.]|uniref:class I adenylate-forming enzyme family protein n=1 Tax=Ramlibacter sp. TaxID=1917967 RepID=UPI0035B0BBBE